MPENSAHGSRMQVIRSEQQIRIYRSIEFMQEHLHLPLTGEEIASAAGFSHFHFHRLFHELTGETPMQSLNRLRLERAANLLIKNPMLKVTQIAMDCGFSSPAVFSRSFKQAYHIAPINFRMQQSMPDFQILPASHQEQDSLIASCLIDLSVKDMPALQVAAIPSEGGYNLDSICAAWQSLNIWAQARQLIHPDTWALGISLDDPTITAPQQCRYYAAVVLRQPVNVSGQVTAFTIPAGNYLFCHFKLIADQIQAAYRWVYQQALPHAQYHYSGGMVYERYLLFPQDGSDRPMDMEVVIPVMK
jgi:AraC family transcriptional regulator